MSNFGLLFKFCDHLIQKEYINNSQEQITSSACKLVMCIKCDLSKGINHWVLVLSRSNLISIAGISRIRFVNSLIKYFYLEAKSMSY